MRSLRWYALIAFVAVHLLFVGLCGVWNQLDTAPASISPLLSVYGNYTGADGRYGFFAPQVAPQVVATVTGRDASGREFVEIHNGKGREAELRLTSSLLHMAKIPVYDTPAAALSVEMFNRLPDAREVTVQFSRYQIPSMSEYRAGKRPYSQELYRATFRRKQDIAPITAAVTSQPGGRGKLE